MTDFGKVKSNFKPDPIKFDDYAVWIHTNIIEIVEDGGTCWEYNMVRMPKNDYLLKLQSEIDFLTMLLEVNL